jgi:hypothetical protein
MSKLNMLTLPKVPEIQVFPTTLYNLSRHGDFGRHIADKHTNLVMPCRKTWKHFRRNQKRQDSSPRDVRGGRTCIEDDRWKLSEQSYRPKGNGSGNRIRRRDAGKVPLFMDRLDLTNSSLPASSDDNACFELPVFPCLKLLRLHPNTRCLSSCSHSHSSIAARAIARVGQEFSRSRRRKMRIVSS